MALGFVLRADRCLESFFVVATPALAGSLKPVALDLSEHAGSLLATHYRDACVRPHPQEAGAEGPAAHAVISRAEAAADNDSQLRHTRAGNSSDQLGTVLRDAAGLVFLADHEAGDVLQEYQRNPALRAQFDEVRAFQCRLRIQNAVVADNAHRITVQVREPADQRAAVKGLEFVEFAGVDDSCNYFPNVE